MSIKQWHTGYDSTAPGNFIDINTLTGDGEEAFNNQITAIFEQKGILAKDVQKYIDMAKGTGSTKEALDWASKQTGYAEDRGDVWGSGVGAGRDYIDKAVQGTDSNEEAIRALYEKGFGREADTEGLNYWLKEMDDGASFADVAKNFGLSEEADIRDVYHDNYGRDVDDVGLQYWMKEHGDQGAEVAERVITSGEADESKVRDIYAEKLGQFSNEADRQAYMQEHGISWWTDAQEGGYADLDWTDVTGSGGGFGVVEKEADYTGVAKFVDALGNKVQTIQDVRDILGQREKLMNISSTYDIDDAEGGTGIGRIFTLAEMEPYMDQSTDLHALATKLGSERWALLTKELMKFPKPGDWGEWEPGPVIGTPGSGYDERYTNRNTLHSDYDVPVPDDYSRRPGPNVTKTKIDYMPNVDGSFTERPV